MATPLRVAYLLSRFPQLTETFILREMLLLCDLGLDIQVFSMLPPHSGPVHRQVQQMMPYVHYSPFLLSGRLILAQLHYVFHSPVKYVSAFARAVWQTYREPLVLLRVLLLFPKSVYFARQLQALEVDHIHAHFVWINGIAARIASDLTGITFSLHPHAFDLFMRDQENVRRQLELADRVVTVSQYHRSYIARLCPRWSPAEIMVVHYGLDPTEFEPCQSPPEDSTLRLVSVGRLEEKKGFEYLIEACALLADKGYSFRCSIIGKGSLRDQLQARIERHHLQNRVLLLGARDQVAVQDLYRHSDIFVLPCVIASSGDRDGMPNVLLEAMALQLPVVTTSVTGIPELVHDGRNGFLVPERNAQALADGIERLINDPALRLTFGKRGRETVLAGFDIHQTAAQLARILQETPILPKVSRQVTGT